MNRILQLSPETEAKLREQAAATGRAPEELAIEALQEQLSSSSPSAAPLSADEWIADVRSWVKSHRRRPHDADDSRKSIFAGRGERTSSIRTCSCDWVR